MFIPLISMVNINCCSTIHFQMVFFPTFEVISLEDCVQILQILKSKCTKCPPLSYCSINRHLTFEEKGGRRRRCSWSYDVVCLCVCVCARCVMHESTTPETVTMERNGLCDTCRYIMYARTYHIYISRTFVSVLRHY